MIDAKDFEGCDGCSTGDCLHTNVNDCVAAQGKIIAEQAAIIAKLPKTADGVPIVPGMTVWLNDPAGVIECEVFAVPPPHVQVQVIISRADGSPVDVSKTELFSTEAAALAAKGEKLK